MINFIRFLRNLRGQESGTLWMIIGAIVLILALLIVFLLTGKLSSLGGKVVNSLG